MVPVSVLGPEFCLGEMTEYGSHGYFASAPGLAEVKLKTVVLDVLVSSVALRDHPSEEFCRVKTP